MVVPRFTTRELDTSIIFFTKWADTSLTRVVQQYRICNKEGGSGEGIGTICTCSDTGLTAAGPTVAQLEAFFSSDYL